MGEAKRRGTYEQRKAAAIEKAGVCREEKRRIEAEKLAAMTEEERQKRHDQQIAFVQWMSTCLSHGVLPYSIPRR